MLELKVDALTKELERSRIGDRLGMAMILSSAPLTGPYDTFYCPSPVQPDPAHRCGVMSLEIKGSGCCSLLNALQITFATSGPYDRLAAGNLLNTIALSPANDDIPCIVSRPHVVAIDL